ncbi:hypothetical protein LCGC14_2253960 [marine sediment metagenome]|uniref:Uncharacterized protein n=1 Tax=marine sediment metagenome TaxID=412755 RepID=A0A0F9DP62_9ZZZZ
MMIVGSDFIDNNTSFNTVMKRNGPNVFVQAYAESGIVANTPMAVQFMGSGYNATVLIGSVYGYVGLPEDGASLASGCVGWVQIRGKASDVQGGTASFKGSVGHNVYWAGGTGLGATVSGNVGNQDIGQVGVLLEEADDSTTALIYLTGMWATPI